MDAKLIGSSKALSAAITVGYKIESSSIKDILRMVANVEVKTPVSPVYEVKLVSSAELPRVNILLNNEQLLQQALQVVLNGHVEFGYAPNPKESIRMKSLWSSQNSKKRLSVPLLNFYAALKKNSLNVLWLMFVNWFVTKLPLSMKFVLNWLLLVTCVNPPSMT